MNEDEIKTAAEKYLSSDEPHYFQDPCDLDVRDAFIAGAKWILEQAYSKGTLSDWMDRLLIGRRQSTSARQTPHSPNSHLVSGKRHRWNLTAIAARGCTTNRATACDAAKT